MTLLQITQLLKDANADTLIIKRVPFNKIEVIVSGTEGDQLSPRMKYTLCILESELPLILDGGDMAIVETLIEYKRAMG